MSTESPRVEPWLLIMLSAFVMSMFLVPSLTALLGHKAWWPGHGDVAPAAAPAGSRQAGELVAKSDRA